VIITLPQIDNVFDYWILFEPDHLRILMKYHNFWLYKNFVSFLKKLNLNYKKKGKEGIVAFYVVTSEKFFKL